MKYDETISAVNKIIDQYDMPLTLRQIYYRLVAGGLVPNRRSAYNSLSSQLVTARENGEVDDSRIVDRSRRVDKPYYDSPESFIDAIKYTLEHKYLHSFWISQPLYVEVWVEKDALSGVISNAVFPFSTIVAPSRGYSSYSYLRDASQRIGRYCQDGKEAHILHFADHDPSGLDMTRDLQDRLNRYCGRAVAVKRIALTYEQVQTHNLIPNPTKMADPRSEGYIQQYGEECWELDAIEPDELIAMCEIALSEEIRDEKAWGAIEREDKAERELIAKRLEELEL